MKLTKTHFAMLAFVILISAAWMTYRKPELFSFRRKIKRHEEPREKDDSSSLRDMKKVFGGVRRYTDDKPSIKPMRKFSGPREYPRKPDESMSRSDVENIVRQAMKGGFNRVGEVLQNLT